MAQVSLKSSVPVQEKKSPLRSMRLFKMMSFWMKTETWKLLTAKGYTRVQMLLALTKADFGEFALYLGRAPYMHHCTVHQDDQQWETAKEKLTSFSSLISCLKFAIEVGVLDYFHMIWFNFTFLLSITIRCYLMYLKVSQFKYIFCYFRISTMRTFTGAITFENCVPSKYLNAIFSSAVFLDCM